MPRFVADDLPLFVSLFVAIGAVLSLVTIVADLPRRRHPEAAAGDAAAAAHDSVRARAGQAVVDGGHAGGMVLAGRRFYPVGAACRCASFTLAAALQHGQRLSMGFVIASVVPTARFAQPLARSSLSDARRCRGCSCRSRRCRRAQAVSRVLPFTYAVSLLGGIWQGEGWRHHPATSRRWRASSCCSRRWRRASSGGNSGSRVRRRAALQSRLQAELSAKLHTHDRKRR